VDSKRLYLYGLVTDYRWNLSTRKLDRPWSMVNSFEAAEYDINDQVFRRSLPVATQFTASYVSPHAAAPPHNLHAVLAGCATQERVPKRRAQLLAMLGGIR
jgi:hypothetical protein